MIVCQFCSTPDITREIELESEFAVEMREKSTILFKVRGT